MVALLPKRMLSTVGDDRLMNGIDRFEESLDLAFWGTFYLLPVLPLLVYVVIYCSSLVLGRLRRVPALETAPSEPVFEQPMLVPVPVAVTVSGMPFTSAQPASS